MATGWTWGQVDDLEWPHLLALYRYWKQNPPMHILIKGIASGLAGERIGDATPPKNSATPTPSSTRVQTAEELIGIMRGAGINVGVVHGGR